METARDYAEQFVEGKPKAGNTFRRMRNGQGEYLVDNLSSVEDELYCFEDFVNDTPKRGPTEGTARVIVNFLTKNGVLEETEEGYEPLGDVRPEDFVEELRGLDYSWVE